MTFNASAADPQDSHYDGLNDNHVLFACCALGRVPTTPATMAVFSRLNAEQLRREEALSATGKPRMGPSTFDQVSTADLMVLTLVLSVTDVQADLPGTADLYHLIKAELHQRPAEEWGECLHASFRDVRLFAEEAK